MKSAQSVLLVTNVVDNNTSPTFQHIKTFITATKNANSRDMKYRPVSEVQELLKAGLTPVVIKRTPDTNGTYFKHPTYAGWNKTPHPAEGELEAFLDRFDAPVNYGVLTGGLLPSGRFLTAIDVDSKSSGLLSLANLLDSLGIDFGSLTKTLTCVTQSGGLHFYLGTKSPIPQKQGLGGDLMGIDIRSAGGLVVGGGSVMKDAEGNTTFYIYNQVKDYQILECPAPLEEYLLATFNDSNMSKPVAANLKTSSSVPTKRPRKHDDRLFSIDPSEVGEGDRHRYLLSLAGHLSKIFETFSEYEAEILSANAKLSKPKTNAKELADIVEYGWGEKPKTPTKPVIRSYKYVKKVVPVEAEDAAGKNRVEYVIEMLKSCQDNEAFLLPLKDKRIVAYAQSQDETPILLGLGEGTITIIQDGNTLLNYLSDYYDVDLLPMQHSSYNLTSARYLDYLKLKASTLGVRYSAISLVPEFEPLPGTLYLCRDVKPEKNGLFRELMNIFTFESMNNRYKFTAAMFSMLLNSSWIRMLPLLMMRAKNKSAGKTNVVQMGSKLIQGETAIPLVGNDKDADQFNSLTTMGNRMCLYDNLTNPDNRTLDQITINITSEVLQMHIMHVVHGKVRNNKLHVATINADSAVNDDVIERAMPCHMSASVTKEQKLEVTRFLQAALANPTYTQRLQADMLFWMEEGKKFEGKVENDCPPKVGMWAEKVAPMVYAMYEDTFEKPYINFAADEDDREKSKEYMSGKLAIADLWASHGTEHDFFFVPFDDFKKILNEQNLTGAGLRSRIGRWLVSFSGKVNIAYKCTKNARGYTINIIDRDFFSSLIKESVTPNK